MEKEFINRKIFNTINLFFGAVGIISWQFFYLCLWFFSGPNGIDINFYFYAILLIVLLIRVLYGVVSWNWKDSIGKKIYFGFIGGKLAWHLSLIVIVLELILCLPVVLGSLFLMNMAGS